MMNSKKVKGIIKFSITKGIQNKWFIILNIFILLATLVTTNINSIDEFLKNHNINLFDEEFQIEVVDNENIGFKQIEKEFEDIPNVEIKKVEENTYTKDTITDTVIVIEIGKDEETIIKGSIISKESLNAEIYEKIYTSIEEIRAEEFSKKYNISLDELKIMNEEINIERIMLAVDADNYETKEMIKYLSTIAIYIVSIIVFSKISNDVAQEKVSKSIEYVLTSVSEKEYLFAKIASIILTVLLQGVYCIMYYIVGTTINSLITVAQIQSGETINLLELVSGIDTEIVLYILTIVLYGVLTLVLLGIIQAALSSKTTSMTEASDTMTLLTMITLFAYMITLFMITPETKMSLLIYILACIPLLSNYFIPAIMIIGQATPILFVISLAFLIISIPIAFNICAKIFKNGVLDYNSKKSKKKKKAELSLIEEQELKFKKAKYRNFSFVIGMALILYIVVQVIGQIVLYVGAVPLLKNIFTDVQVELIIMCALSIICLGVSILFINLYKNKDDKIEKKKLKFAEKFEILLIGIFLVGIIQIIVTKVSEIFGIEYSIGNVVSSFTEDKGILTNILLFVSIALQAGIFEELLFRKAFIDYSKRFGKVFAVIISSVLFGLIHLNLSQFIFALLIGIVFGIIYVVTGNISLTIILHTLNNAYSVFLMIFEHSEIMVEITNVIVIALMVLGAMLLIRKIITNRKEIKNQIKNIKLDKKALAEYKYMIMDFSFIVSMVSIILIFIATENMLSNL